MQVEQHYKNYQYNKINRNRKQAIMAMLNPDADKIILDIGCSGGNLGKEIKEMHDCKFYGIDISADAVEIAKNVLDNAWKLNVEEDFNLWPQELKDKQFDCVIASEMLEHLFDPENLLVKLKKLAKTNKKIIITVPNILFWKNRLKLLLGNFTYTKQGLMDRGHIHFFSWDSLNKMILNSGYEIISINNHIPTRGTKWLGKIWPGLFSFQFIVKIIEKNNVI